jgi:hypothetical protein
MKQAITILFAALTAAALTAQTPLPPNYKTTFENPDLLVMHVHYGAHEFVPMHDHPAVPTLYVYLNDAGEVDIIHEGPNAVTAHRPPTHTGAFRIAPAIAERHSIQSNSDTDSDFLRVEFKHLTLSDLPEAGKHVAANLTPGIHTEFQDASLHIDRILCAANSPCSVPPTSTRSLLIAIQPTSLQTPTGERNLKAGEVAWLPANAKSPLPLNPSAQCLRVSLLYPE